MHELSIALEICRNVERALTDAAGGEPGGSDLKEKFAGRVRLVKVRVGELSGVEPDSLSFSFEAAVKGTVLDGARLDIVKVPVKYRCGGCSAETAGEFPLVRCPACASAKLELIGGRELEVLSAEVDDGK